MLLLMLNVFLESSLGYVQTRLRDCFFGAIHFRDRRYAASLRHRNRAEITVVMREQKLYPVWFTRLRKSYPYLPLCYFHLIFLKFML